jgi:hypothetical protein
LKAAKRVAHWAAWKAEHSVVSKACMRAARWAVR